MSFFVNTLNGVASASYLAEKMATSTGPRNLSVTTGSHTGLYEHDMNDPTATYTSYTDTYAVEPAGPAPSMTALPTQGPGAAPAPTSAATSTPYLGLVLVAAALFLLTSKGKR